MATFMFLLFFRRTAHDDVSVKSVFGSVFFHKSGSLSFKKNVMYSTILFTDTVFKVKLASNTRKLLKFESIHPV